LLAGATGSSWPPPVRTIEEAADPRELALGFGIRLRRVRLYRRLWWRRQNGPLLAFRRTDGSPVALLPAWLRAYRAHEPGRATVARLDDAGAAALSEEAFMPYPRARSLQRGDWLGVSAQGGSPDALKHLLYSAVAACLSLAPAVAVLALDRLVREDRQDMLGLVFLSLAAVAGSVALFGHSREIAALRWRGRTNLRAHAALWDRLLDASGAAFRRMPAWHLSAKLIAALKGAQRELDARLLLQKGAAEIAVALILLSVVMPPAMLVAIAALAVAAAVRFVLERRAESAADAVEALRPSASRGAYLIARFLPQLRTLASENWLLSKVKAQFADIIAGTRAASSARIIAAQGSCVAGLGVCAAVGSVAASRPESSIGVLACVLLLSFSASRSAAAVGSSLATYRSNRARMDHIAAVIDGSDGAAAGVGGFESIERVELDGVSFRYPGQSAACLDAVDLSIERGEVIALTGPSGSGKSTLVRLLMDLDRPSAGTVRVNGRDLAGVDAAAYRRRIGAVFQDQQISPATVRTVILGMAPLSAERAWEAVRAAQLDDVIAKLPMGLETIVSERSFPAGYQRQLLIARALARSPDLLVLDEAMAPLDELVQARLLTALRRMGTTVVFCAHRPSTLALADRVVRLSRGRIERAESSGDRTD